MAINALGSIDVPLSLFGGLNTELQPPDIPEGVSPDNQDVVYLPGSVDSRPCLHKIFATAFPVVPPLPEPTVMYGKTYVQPNNNPLNLYLDSNGIFYQEDVVNTPGTYSQVGTTTPGLYAQSVTAFGREYIAFSDLLHGQDVPVQYDGTNFDRVTQDGPGAAPAVADENLVYNLLAAPNGAIYNTASTPVLTASQSGNLITFTMSPTFAGFNLETGDPCTVAGFSGTFTGYNNTYAISFVSEDQTTVQVVSSTVGLPTFSGGAGGGNFEVGKIDFVTSVTPNITVGESFTTAGVGVAGYNGTFIARGVFPLSFTVRAIIPVAALGNSGGGTLTADGTITPGVHQCVYMFLKKSGYLTKPSPAFSWVASGTKRAVVTDLLIGPPNVIARVLAFTGAGGDNFFTITQSINLPNPTGGLPIQIQALVVPDNTSTSVTVDFSDDSLFAGQGIDIPGNNLFAQVVLGPVSSFFTYAGRLGTYGEWNKVQNFLNMAFDGGSVSTTIGGIPPGWSSTSTTGTVSLVTSIDPVRNFSCEMVSSGGAFDAEIEQPAYEDANGAPILTPLTGYNVRFFAQRSVHSIPINGAFIVELFSATAGSMCKFTGLAAGTSVDGSWITGSMIGMTPATIPTDAVLRVYMNNVSSGLSITIDELELIYAENPYIDTTCRLSYVNNPEAFDGVTGNLGADSDPTPLRTFVTLRDNLYFHTSGGLHYTADNASGEPSTWTVRTIPGVGAISIRATDSGEDWFITASQGGPYVFAGGDLYKAGQEIQSLWASINPAVSQLVWVKNDIINRRCYLGVPTGTATAPSLVLPLDYRELNTAYDVASNGPVHISYSGKMISSDLTRKWTRWNIKANFGEILNRGGGISQMCFGAGNAQTPGAAVGFGNVYYLDPTLLTDDDYGEMFPYYVTYAFINHEAEVALGTGCHRKLYGYLTMFVSGTGQMTVIPLVDALTNAWPQTATYPLIQQPSFDLEWGLNVLGERCFFKILPSPTASTVLAQYAITGTSTTPTGMGSGFVVATVNFSNAAVITPGTTIIVANDTLASVNGTHVVEDSGAGFVQWTQAGSDTATGTGGTIQILSPANTDVNFSLKKMVVSIRQDAWTPVRGTIA